MVVAAAAAAAAAVVTVTVVMVAMVAMVAMVMAVDAICTETLHPRAGSSIDKNTLNHHLCHAGTSLRC